MKWKLFLDDERVPVTNDWLIARNIEDAKWFIQSLGMPTEMTLDHDLGPNLPTGYDFVRWLVEQDLDEALDEPLDSVIFNVHSQNPVGAENMRALFKNYVQSKI